MEHPSKAREVDPEAKVKVKEGLSPQIKKKKKKKTI
jgi:hypothetical protein